MASTMGEILEAAEMIHESDYVIALTGAGISAESHIPTFRGPDGLWKNYSAMDLATPQAFARDPDTVWEWYHWRQGLMRECKPNPAHETLGKWEKDGILKHLITQNVDDLHYRAGSRKMSQVHGNIFALKCTQCDYKTLLNELMTSLPTCPKCSAILRPDVVWFGETLDPLIIAHVHEHLVQAELILVIGTSGIVHPAASFPIVVKQQGGNMIEINIEQTPLTHLADVHVSGKAGELLPVIDTVLSEY